MYTKKMQNFMDMTTEDFSDEQVLNLDGDKATNFAVYNEQTTVVSYQNGANQMTDNGGGSYTVQNAGTEITSLRAGDTFAYTDAAGEVSIIKVKTIQTNGSTVTITEDENVELEDVFDYVKIEGGYQQEISDEERASAIEYELEENKYSKTEKFDWTKKLGSGDLTATLKASGALTAAPYVKLYLALSYQYVEFTLTMSASFDCSADGKLARQSVDLLPKELSFSPVVGVTVTFMPQLEFEASGNVSFSAKMVAVAGFSFDGKNGFVNKSSRPQLTKCDFHVEATVYLGLGLQPGVEVTVAKVEAGSLTLNLQVGAQITAKMDGSGVKNDGSHLCKACIAGEIVGKIKLDATLVLVFLGTKTKEVVDNSKKLTDFYYSIDYKDFGWTTCPHIACKITLTVTDVNQKVVSGAVVEGTNLETTPVTDGSGRAEFYLPNGSYTLKVTKGDLSKTVDLKVKDKAETVSVQLAKPGTTGNGICGENLTWNLNETGALTISGTGNMTSWSSASQTPWYKNREKITSVVLENGVTGVGAYAFAGCTNLAGAEIPDGVTEIGDYAFDGCANLPSVALPDSVTYIGNYAFQKNTRLTSVKMPAGLTRIGNSAFDGCTILAGVEIPAGVTNIGNYAFRACNGLTSIRIPESVANIGDYAFFGCSYLLQADIKGGTLGSHAFYGCSSLTTVSLGDKVTEIGKDSHRTEGVFGNCTSLKSIVIPDSIKRIENFTFYGCTSLSSVTFGNELTDISYSAFEGCTHLGSITFPSSLKSIDWDAFKNCTSLSSIRFTGNAPSFSSTPFDGVTATAYYPANDDTWEKFHKYTTGGALTWVSYDPAENPSAEQENAAFFNQKVSQPAPEQPDFQEVPNEFSLENPNEGLIESEPPTAQAFTPLEVSDARAAASPQTAPFTGLTPGGDYVLLVSKDSEGANPLSPSNLLYIAQGRADSSGSLTFTYIPRTDEAAQAKVYGSARTAADTDIGTCTLTLSEYFYPYDGQTKEPGVTVKMGETTLTEGTDYTLSYRNNANVGKASVIVTGIGAYTGTKTEYFFIEEDEEPTKPNKPAQTVKTPAKTKLTKVANQKGRKLVVRWKRKAKVSGYQIQYSTGKKFGAGTKKVNVAGAKKTSRTIGRLKKGKNYYVRIRTYKKAAGKIYYSKWSNAKKIKIKK